MNRTFLGYCLLTLAPSVATACMPPPVKAIDQWLQAYEHGDIDGMLKNTAAADRGLVKQALETQTSSPTSDLAMAMPTKPTEHEVKEIDSKDPNGQWQVVTVKVTMKNPLPVVSKKIGQKLDGIPEVRSQWRKFKAVKEGDQWGVRLDLAAVLARSEFVAKFHQILDRGGLNEAEAMLAQVPPPPDDPNAQKNADRLKDALTADLKMRREALANPPEPVEAPPEPETTP